MLSTELCLTSPCPSCVFFLHRLRRQEDHEVHVDELCLIGLFFFFVCVLRSFLTRTSPGRTVETTVHRGQSSESHRRRVYLAAIMADRYRRMMIY